MSYFEAIAALNKLINSRFSDGRPTSATVLTNDFSYQSVGVKAVRRQLNLQRMSTYLQILDLEEAISHLNVIHVAGTKGKGSTCAFSESILRSCGYRTGLFTSPHLVDIRERFRLNGVEVSEECFAKHFWWCWNRLQSTALAGESMPGYFPFLTLLAFKMFTSENVDVAIIEVGLGGRYDATNVVKAPVVCGITSLGFDHMEILGNTLADIAYEKAGIFKAGVPAFSVPQEHEAMDVLQKEAGKLSVTLEVPPCLESYNLDDLHLGLQGDHQRINAALAVALCACWENKCQSNHHWSMVKQRVLPAQYSRGLAKVYWPGRGQLIYDKTLERIPNGCANGRVLATLEESGTLSFYLDGAHSPESMDACAKWFCNTTHLGAKNLEDGCLTVERLEQHHSHCKPEDQASIEGHLLQRVLLFNCMPKRDPKALLSPLICVCAQKGLPFHMALFVPPFSSTKSIDTRNAADIAASTRKMTPDLSWQHVLQQSWESLLQENFAGSESLEPRRFRDELLGLRNIIQGKCASWNQPCVFGSSSAILPSLHAAVSCLRQHRRGNPRVQIQVLVTGSLYLVGDLLKILSY